MKFNLKKLFGAVGVVSVALALGGCGSTMITPEQAQTLFEPGEQTLYFNVIGMNKNLPVNSACKDDIYSLQVTKESNADLKERFCGKEQNYQLVQGVFYNGPIKGVQTTWVMISKEIDVGVDDIVKLKTNHTHEGKLVKINTFIALVKKDGAKEPKDCYWEGGKRMTGAFARGGIVCEGWDWKKQKFAQ